MNDRFGRIIPIVKCYLCHKNTAKIFIKAKKRILFRCALCDLIYTLDTNNSSPVQQKEREFLTEYLRESDNYRMYFRAKMKLVDNNTRKGRLLDVGSGAGIFLQCAVESGWKAVGVDSSFPSIEYARQQGFTVKQGLFEKTRFPPGHFAAITSFQTIEHVTDPLAFLKHAKRFLKKNGLLLLTTPDENSFLSRLLGKRWFGYYNKEHLFFFNENSLTALLTKAGYTGIIIRKESSRPMHPSWVFARMFHYYYNEHYFWTQFAQILKPIWYSLDRINLREPEVNLVVLAFKE